MSDRRRGLGRGLGALIPSGPPSDDVDRPVDVFFAASDVPRETGNGWPADSADGDHRGALAPLRQRDHRPTHLLPVDGAHFAEIPVSAITPNPRQPRQAFDEDALAELVASIRELGLLQPVVVRPTEGERFELVMGERRWRAVMAAGLPTIPAIVRETRDEAMLRDALLENLHRSELNPLEEAAAYQQLLDDFGCTHDELAGRIGRSRPQISNTIRLLRLPPHVQRRVAAGVLSAGHARALLGLGDGAAQERLAQRIVAEGLSVRSVEEIVALGGDATGVDAGPRPAGAGSGRSPQPVPPRVSELAGWLGDLFDTRVKVDVGRSKGKIVIEFATLDDLERIADLLTGPASAQPARYQA